jgi:hypothetical protein
MIKIKEKFGSKSIWIFINMSALEPEEARSEEDKENIADSRRRRSLTVRPSYICRYTCLASGTNFHILRNLERRL